MPDEMSDVRVLAGGRGQQHAPGGGLTPHGPDGNGVCWCPSCALASFVTLQFVGDDPNKWPNTVLGSEHRTALKRLKRCPVFDAFGFCYFGMNCALDHDDHRGGRRNATPAVTRLTQELVQQTLNTTALLAELVDRGEEESCRDEDDAALPPCRVCGNTDMPLGFSVPVGETFAARGCPRCTMAVHFPDMSFFVTAAHSESNGDYQKFKDIVDEARRQLPSVFKVPLSYEAHRFATVTFGWSLVSSSDAEAAWKACQTVMPSPTRVVSMGCGSGYTEHLFRLAASKVFFASGGGGGGGQPISFFAFDEYLPKRPNQYSVSVSVGTPDVLRSFPSLTDTVLLMCWPPFGSQEGEQSTMAYETLTLFAELGGRLVVYIGDTSSTGDWRFQEELAVRWKPVRGFRTRRELRRWVPHEMGLVFAGNDTMGVYERRRM